MEERREAFEALQRRGRASPLDRRPDIYPDVMDVWTAFFRLGTSRPVTMAGVGSIPFEAVDRYAARFGVEDFEEFYTLMSRLDAAYLEHIREEDD